jgi:hypothetical protein
VKAVTKMRLLGSEWLNMGTITYWLGFMHHMEAMVPCMCLYDSNRTTVGTITLLECTTTDVLYVVG